MIRRIVLGASFLLLSVSASRATISFLIDGDQLRDSAGNAIGQSSLFVLVSSTTDLTFGAITEDSSTAVGSLLNGDDKILFRGDLATFGTGSNGVVSAATGGLTLDSGLLSGWTSGDPLALLWFPTLTTASGTIASGTTYGLYTNGTPVDGSDAWITPTDPTTDHALLFYTQAGSDLSPGAGASNLSSAGNASLTVAGIPEPSRALLGMIGLTALGLRRRRR